MPHLGRAEVWHPERWGVASGALGCGIPDAGVWRFSRVSVSAFSMKAAGFATSTNGQFRSRRRYCPVGVALRRDGAAQVGAPSVHKQLVAVGVGRCGGGLLLFEALQQHMQFLRGALAGLGVEREVASHFFLAVHPLLFSEEYDVFLEFFQCRIKMLVQQDTVAASHADHFTEQLVFDKPSTCFLQLW